MPIPVLSDIVSEFTKQVASDVYSFLKDFAKSEIKQFFQDGLEPYLDKQAKKYSFIKTLLHRAKPVYLYHIYQPIKLKFKNEVEETNSIKELFGSKKFITVIGDAGSGKTTLIKHLQLNSIFENFKIPIFIELRYLNDSKISIEDDIKEKVFENKLAINDKILTRLLEKGKFLFCLDGYDEINSEIRNKVVMSLNSFINKYNTNHYILTSRPYSNIEMLPLFYNYEIEPFSQTDVEEFIKKQMLNKSIEDKKFKEREELTNKMLKTVKAQTNQYIFDYLTNPLLLTLFILKFQKNAAIPTKRYLFYREVFRVLCDEHDSFSKLGYERERTTRLSVENFEKVLRLFSLSAYFKGKTDFDYDFICSELNGVKEILKGKFSFINDDFINDLKRSIPILIENGLTVSFAHNSLQEYFAALAVKDIRNKKEIYKRINDKLIKSQDIVENFLTLCKEMDEADYNKYLLLPIYEKILELFIDQDVNKQIFSVTQFFYSNFSYTSRNENGNELVKTLIIRSNTSNYNYLFFLKDFEYKLYGNLSDFLELENITSQLLLENKEEIDNLANLRDLSLDIKPILEKYLNDDNNLILCKIVKELFKFIVIKSSFSKKRLEVHKKKILIY